MRQYTIYCLKESTGEIRYFGQTRRKIQRRFSQHLQSKPTRHVSCWIKSLLSKNRVPICEVLMTGLEKWEVDEEEIALIAWGRKKGLRLTNLTDGGDGAPGCPKSKKFKRLMSKRLRGVKFLTDHKRKIAASHQGNNKNGVSGYFGVYLFRQSGKWRAMIGFRKKVIHLGLFKKKEDAARAYDAAASKYYGPPARLNFPRV